MIALVRNSMLIVDDDPLPRTMPEQMLLRMGPQ
jgi:hypothetical protein